MNISRNTYQPINFMYIHSYEAINYATTMRNLDLFFSFFPEH